MIKIEEIRTKVYVGTYRKYNEGSIAGKWFYPADYDTLNDFISACCKLHNDEKEPELMFQDYEYLPKCLYEEGCFSEKAFAFAKAFDKTDEKDALIAYVDLACGHIEDDPDFLLSDFEDNYIGEFSSDEEACEEDAEMFLNAYNVPDCVRNYFDYEAFARTMMIDYFEQDGFYFRAV